MKLEATNRQVLGKRVKNLRLGGLAPASVYGPKKKAESIAVDEKKFSKLFEKVGFNKFFELEVENEKPSRVLIKDVHYHPVKDYIYNISFYAIDEDRKISVDVPINLVGEAPAVKQNLGFLVQQAETVAVYCLPKDLPDHFEVNIEKLESTGDSINLETLTLPEGVEFDSDVDPNSAIVYIAAFQKEIVEEAPAPVEGEEGAEAASSEAAADTAEEQKDNKSEDKE